MQQIEPTVDSAEGMKRIRGSRATIDEQLEADLRDITNAKHASAIANRTVIDNHVDARTVTAKVDAKLKESSALRAQHTTNPQQGQVDLDRALGIVDESELDEVEPISIPDLTKTRRSKLFGK
jgi:hypothetical protein